MLIGIPKEIKNNENRVAISPAGVKALVSEGHRVLLEHNAGAGSGFNDAMYSAAGAQIMDSASDVWKAEMVIKVKEPLPSEYLHFYPGLLLFTYLHLAAERSLTLALLRSKVTAIAYETVQDLKGALPLLTPMSEVAGRMSVQIGAEFLEKHAGGKGILLGGVPGVKRGKVTVIGGGVAGTNAAKIAVGLGAEVYVIDSNLDRLRRLEEIFGNSISTFASNSFNIAEAVKQSDLVIGAVLIPGAAAPRLVTEEMVKTMEPGSVLVDIAIDQGGCIETCSQVSTHDNPVYEKHGVLHYSVANMPGAVPRTSTLALTNATLMYILKIAGQGFKQACLSDSAVLKGVNTYNGRLFCSPVAKALDLDLADLNEVLNMETGVDY